MRAGQLRHIVNIERKVESRDEFGASIWTWQTFAANVPAAVEPLQGREFFAAQQMQNALSVRIRTRYMPGVRTEMRVRHEVEVGDTSPSVVRYYRIESVLNTDERNRELQLMCSANEADGFVSEKVEATPVTPPETPYLASATHYDGVGDYQKRTSNFTGLVDGKKGTLSCFFLLTQDAVSLAPLMSDGQNLGLFLYSYASFPYQLAAIAGYSALGANILYIQTNAGAIVPDASFQHLIASWDVESGALHFYLGDVDVRDSGQDVSVNAAIKYDWPRWFSSAYDTGGVIVPEGPGCQAEVFFHPDYIDLSVEANRRKFISADLKPVYLGANGELPFGTPPIFYSPEGNGTNLGTGGDLTAFGAPSVCGSAP